MMKWLGIALAASLMLPAMGFAQEVRQPRAKIELGDITLLDGRTLSNARLLGATEKALNIAHSQGIEQIERARFAQEFLETYKAEILATGSEYRDEAGLRRNERIKARLEAEATARERKRNADEIARLEKKAMADYEKREAAAAKLRQSKEAAEARRAEIRAAELARSRDGLLLDFLTRYYDGCALSVRNVHENPRRLDWRELRARKTDGRLVIPVNCESDDDRDRSLDIRSGEKRTFRIRFMGGNDDIEAVTWADGSQEIEPWKPAPKAPAETLSTDGQ